MRALLVLALVAASVALPSSAAAQVRLPNGDLVPVYLTGPDTLGETQLYELFDARGEAIHFINDARADPDTFSPLCEDFSASLVLKESASTLGVGWYNVLPGATTRPTSLYTILPAGSAVGTMITGDSIRSHPNYLGGEIGFALLRSPNHYTEARWNTVCNAGACASTPGPWILSLSYLSSENENAFYVAFEDGNTSASDWQNDGDYNDYVFFFTGLACSGAGEPCEVDGGLGVCAAGITQCATGGALVCAQVNEATAERCDGADNDCDGEYDEGDLCGARQVCSRGQCVERCDFEFGCADETDACEEGLCVDPACVGITCEAGLACVDGGCVDACAGVVCPGAQTCRVGACVDPCEDVTCDEGFVCEGGVCLDGCGCRGCDTGLSCAPSGECVDTACLTVTCPHGSICHEGVCFDACEDAVCPRGQECRVGECVDVTVGPTGDAGVPLPDAGSEDAGSPTEDAGGPDVDAGGNEADAGAPATRTDEGCGCGARTAPGSALPLLVFALFIRRRP